MSLYFLQFVNLNLFCLYLLVSYTLLLFFREDASQSQIICPLTYFAPFRLSPVTK